MNGGKQIGKDSKQGEEGFRNAEVEDHDAVERAVNGHERHGDGGVDEGKLEAFEKHVVFTTKYTKGHEDLREARAVYACAAITRNFRCNFT